MDFSRILLELWTSRTFLRTIRQRVVHFKEYFRKAQKTMVENISQSNISFSGSIFFLKSSCGLSRRLFFKELLLIFTEYFKGLSKILNEMFLK